MRGGRRRTDGTFIGAIVVAARENRFHLRNMAARRAAKGGGAEMDGKGSTFPSFG